MQFSNFVSQTIIVSTFLPTSPTIGIDLLQYRAAGLTADSPAYIYELLKDGFVA